MNGVDLYARHVRAHKAEWLGRRTIFNSIDCDHLVSIVEQASNRTFFAFIARDWVRIEMWMDGELIKVRVLGNVDKCYEDMVLQRMKDEE